MQNSRAWNFIRLESLDPLKDAGIELSRILGISLGDAQKLIATYLESPGNLFEVEQRSSIHDLVRTRAIQNLVCHVTQTHRIPYMTERFDWYLNCLDELGINGGASLDYGGGGGKDSILLRKLGFNVEYRDLLSEPFSHFVNSRFAVRGLDIPIKDVRDKHLLRYRLINCQDVIEHCYDVEFVLADIASILEDNGILLMAPTFTFEFNNDHLEKNTAYLSYFPNLCESAGLKLIAKMNWNTEIYQRLPRLGQALSICDERTAIAKRLYGKSQQVSLTTATNAINRAFSMKVLEPTDLNSITDNLAIYRLCSQRLSLTEYKN